MATNKETGAFVRFYRVFRWVVLLALVMVIALMLKRPADVPEQPDPVKAPEQAREFESKLQELQAAQIRGSSGVREEFSADEVNAFITQAMSEATPPSGKNTSSPASDPPPAVKDFRIRLQDDAVVGYFVVDFHGKDLNVTVSGQPGVANGYMTFSPTGFKIGSLPVPISLVNGALQKRLDDPEMHEKLKLPDFIGDLRVQNEQIVIVEK